MTWIAPSVQTFASHAAHVAQLRRPQAPAAINGVRLFLPPNVYHPGVGLSSRFFVDALAAEALQGSVLDLGCGSGYLGLSLYREGMRLVLADISAAALASAAENLRRLAIPAELVVSDLFRALHGRRFDAILFNPPLFDKAIEDEAEVALCDPGGILLARFLAEAGAYLSPQGKIYFMASNLMNRRSLADGLKAYDYDILAATHDDAAGVSRWVIAAMRAGASAA